LEGRYVSVVERQERRRLLYAYKRDGDAEARDLLIADLMPLVRSLALRYSGRGESIEDLVQVGCIGLINAIDRFDTERGVELTTYAVPTILGEIQRHFRDRAWAVHVPRGIKELRARLTRLLDSLTSELGRSPTIEELARAADADEEAVIEAFASDNAYAARSLSAPFDGEDSGGSLGEVLGEEERGYEQVEEGTLVAAGLGALDSRERRIVELRFFHGLTQSQIAAEIGISQMHVSRLLRSALQSMRGRIEDELGVEGVE
jgi:RNA polymerase sigma-B factor